MMAHRFSRCAGFVAAAALVLAQTEASAQTCPDPATIQAARLVEFQTMMMDVMVRCNHVGVPIGEHLTDMSTRHGKQFSEAHDRVATFLRGPATDAPAPPAARPGTGSAAPEPAASAKPKRGVKPEPAGKAEPAKLAPAKPGAAPLAPASRPAAAKLNRRTDPYDMYLTKIGNQYGAGATSVQRCKMFDTIALTLADKSSSSRLLGIVAKSVVADTLLEAIVRCAPAKSGL